MTTTQTLAISAPRFVTVETEAQYVGGIVGAASKHAKADRNLVGSLISAARLIGRAVTEADWSEHLAAPLRKSLKAKVGADSVKVYVSHAKVVTLATCGRPPITEALPVGKHWADQRSGRKAEGVNAYVKRVGALLKLATPNEHGHLILPEGYDLMGNAPKAATPPAETSTAPAETGSAGQSADAEGGVNVSPAKAEADARENAATVLMGNAKAAALLIALIDDKAGKAALAKLLSDHEKAAKTAAAKAEADAKAGAALNKAA